MRASPPIASGVTIQHAERLHRPTRIGRLLALDELAQCLLVNDCHKGASFPRGSFYFAIVNSKAVGQTP